VPASHDSATPSTLGYALLCALHKGPLTGYDLVRRMRAPIGYYWTAQQSQIYPELTRLGALGLVEATAEHGPGPHEKRTHRLTGAGRAALAAWLVQPPRHRPPRDELVLRTYALSVADPAAMRAMYLEQAAGYEKQLADYRGQQEQVRSRGGDAPGHIDFGAYATLELGIRHARELADWCGWVAARLTDPGPAGTGDAGPGS
jgi:DNA-binding PadR family transcriptional regulator